MPRRPSPRPRHCRAPEYRVCVQVQPEHRRGAAAISEGAAGAERIRSQLQVSPYSYDSRPATLMPRRDEFLTGELRVFVSHARQEDSPAIGSIGSEYRDNPALICDAPRRAPRARDFAESHLTRDPLRAGSPRQPRDAPRGTRVTARH